MKVKINKLELGLFSIKVPGFFELKPREQIDYIVYYLTVEKGLGTTQATAIRDCFLLLDISPYSNISKYLLDNIKGKDSFPPKFLRIKNGYQLHRKLKTLIEEKIDNKPIKASVAKNLRDLLSFVSNPNENEFLKEAIECFEISAYRASIIMVWNLTIDHLFEYILKHKSADFNYALAANTDRRIKITSITNKDDFTEIPENKFIEFCRSASIITKDIRKILDEKLGIRNTYAHPSNLKVLESKSIEFIEDLVTNVVHKYSI